MQTLSEMPTQLTQCSQRISQNDELTIAKHFASTLNTNNLDIFWSFTDLWIDTKV